jgi:hypothetical protein
MLFSVISLSVVAPQLITQMTSTIEHLVPFCLTNAEVTFAFKNIFEKEAASLELEPIL